MAISIIQACSLYLSQCHDFSACEPSTEWNSPMVCVIFCHSTGVLQVSQLIRVKGLRYSTRMVSSIWVGHLETYFLPGVHS